MNKGTRVVLHPATAEWMQGDRFGVIVGLGRARDCRYRFTGTIQRIRPIRVKLDKSGRVRRFHPSHVNEL
jgi:hypothetical protein